MHRQWLDWHKPLLPAAAAWLIGQHSDGKRCDLRQVRCVLPGTRAGRCSTNSNSGRQISEA